MNQIKSSFVVLAFIGIAELIFFISLMPKALAERPFITLASTTSTRNSGLYEFLLPKFTEKTGIAVRVIAVGTGQAIRLAKAGDADVLLVHHRESEEAFVKSGYGVKRIEVMYNDFIIVGPKMDPARVRGTNSVLATLRAIADTRSTFASRGDDSGTHKKEQTLWNEAGIQQQRSRESWYRETGSGMGATLNTASAMNAYTIADRGTWLKFANKGNLVIINEGDKSLINPYGIILVNQKKHSHIKKKEGQVFIDWITSPLGQNAIAEYTISGQQAFYPTRVNGLNSPVVSK
tara:strand:+ start:208 stop:1080 length:873 start_codon:yes stop_codon:yes gene_type:complete